MINEDRKISDLTVKEFRYFFIELNEQIRVGAAVKSERDLQPKYIALDPLFEIERRSKALLQLRWRVKSMDELFPERSDPNAHYYYLNVRGLRDKEILSVRNIGKKALATIKKYIAEQTND